MSSNKEKKHLTPRLLYWTLHQYRGEYCTITNTAKLRNRGVFTKTLVDAEERRFCNSNHKRLSIQREFMSITLSPYYSSNRKFHLANGSNTDHEHAAHNAKFVMPKLPIVLILRMAYALAFDFLTYCFVETSSR